MATQYEKLVLLIEQVGLKEAGKAFDDARKKIKGAGDAAQTTSEKVKGTTRAFKGFRGASSALTNTTGQLSVQIQDVAVQLESGTDAIRVFAQQGPQIAAIFGPSGAAFGAILAVGALIAGPFVRSLFQADEALKKASKRISEYEEELTKLTKAEKALKLLQIAKELREIASLDEGLADATESVRELEQGTISYVGAIREMFAGNLSLKQSLLAARIEQAEYNVAIEDGVKRKKELLNQADILRGITTEETKETKKQKESLKELNAELDKQLELIGKSIVEQKVYEAVLLGASDKTIEQIRLKYELLEADKEQEAALKKLREESDRFIESLRQKGDRLTQSESEMLRARIETVLLSDAEKEEALAIIDQIQAREESIKRKKEEKEATRELIEEGRTFRQEVEDEIKLIEDREKARKKAHEAQLKRENEALDDIARAIAEEDAYYQDQSLRQAERTQANVDFRNAEADKEAEYRKKVAEDQTNAILSLEDKLLKGKTEKQKLGFRTLVNYANAGRRQNAIQIISDSKVAGAAAQKALAGIPLVGPILGAAAMASIIAGGYTLAAQSLAGRALGGQVRQGESYVVGERGPEVLTMGANGRIIPNEQLRGQQPAVSKVANVTFNITANDTAGFDRLIQSRRGQIVSIINQALNERGRPAIV